MRAEVGAVLSSLAAEEDASLLAIFVVDLSFAFESIYPQAARICVLNLGKISPLTRRLLERSGLKAETADPFTCNAALVTLLF